MATDDPRTATPVCTHLNQARAVRPDSVNTCPDCTAVGDSWVHLRECQICGHVGCCDSSKNRHATAHNEATGHPLIRSFEPDEGWWWCYEDQVMFEVQDMPPARAV
jgi:ubiquitin-hydrolase Zn-finger-containing protein